MKSISEKDIPIEKVLIAELTFLQNMDLCKLFYEQKEQVFFVEFYTTHDNYACFSLSGTYNYLLCENIDESLNSIEGIVIKLYENPALMLGFKNGRFWSYLPVWMYSTPINISSVFVEKATNNIIKIIENNNENDFSESEKRCLNKWIQLLSINYPLYSYKMTYFPK